MKGKPAWRVAMAEMCDPFGWHELNEAMLRRIHDRLKNFESMTWNEILNQTGNPNHFIPVSDLCSDAKDRLQVLRQDDVDQLLSLRVTGPERIYGIWEQGILRLLWWDPDHAVCPAPKKGT